MVYKGCGNVVYLLGICKYTNVFSLIYNNKHMFINYENINKYEK